MSQTSIQTSTIETTADEQDKYITFRLGSYCFALSSQRVLKIIVAPSSEQESTIDIGLIQLAQHSIQLLDLQSLLKLEQRESYLATKPASKASKTAASPAPAFLIILQPDRAEKELWGIVVDRSPDLQNIPRSQLKPIPRSKRIADALNGISHVVTQNHQHSQLQSNNAPFQEGDRILLVLDTPKLIELSSD